MNCFRRVFVVAALSLLASPVFAQDPMFTATGTKSGATTVVLQSNQAVALSARKYIRLRDFYYKVAGACTITLRYAANVSTTGTAMTKSRHIPTPTTGEATVLIDGNSSVVTGDFILTIDIAGAAEATLDLSTYDLPRDKAFIAVVVGTSGASTYSWTYLERE